MVALVFWAVRFRPQLFAIMKYIATTKYLEGGLSMAYFNYHAKAKRLIADGHLLRFEIVPKWGDIAPALVLYFDNNRPMPIRKKHFSSYLELLHN